MSKVIGFDGTVAKRATCGNCSAVFEYTNSETFDKKYAFDYLGGFEVGTFVKCPNCQADVKEQA